MGPWAKLSKVGASWASWDPLESSEGASEASWRLRVVLLEASWKHLWASWGRLGSSWRLLGASWRHLGPYCCWFLRGGMGYADKNKI